MDLEEAMINRLTQVSGFGYTVKVRKMFTDVSLAGELNKKFTDYLKSSDAKVSYLRFDPVLTFLLKDFSS
jgi:hypothetical protein